MKHVIVFYVERLDPATNKNEELEIEVTADVSQYISAKISGPYENCSPAEGGEIEIKSTVCTNSMLKHLFDKLTDDEENRAKQQIDEEFETYDYGAESEYDEDYDDIDRDFSAD